MWTGSSLLILAAPMASFGMWTWSLLNGGPVRRAEAAMAAGRDDHAFELFKVLSARRVMPHHIRGTVEQSLGILCGRRGDFQAAWKHSRDAALLFGQAGARSAELRRSAEQSAWTFELYLGLLAGKTELGADTLRDREAQTVAGPDGGPLLALLAWAHYVAGDRPAAWRLFRLAEQRLAGRTLAELPRLEAWMTEHRAEATAS